MYDNGRFGRREPLYKDDSTPDQVRPRVMRPGMFSEVSALVAGVIAAGVIGAVAYWVSGYFFLIIVFPFAMGLGAGAAYAMALLALGQDPRLRHTLIAASLGLLAYGAM